MPRARRRMERAVQGAPSPRERLLAEREAIRGLLLRNRNG